jgi:hypothetical protein
MNPSRQLWFMVALSVAACPACGGRAGFGAGDAAVALVSVSTPETDVGPGSRAVLVQLSVVNRTESSVALLRAELVLPPNAGLFERADLRPALPTIAARSSAVIDTYLDVPTHPPGQADIDGVIWAASSEDEKLYVDEGADSVLHLDFESHEDQPSPDRDLIVTVTTDEQDGDVSMSTVLEAGGPDALSLREAMLIANNRVGPDRILFSPSVFPPGSVQTITIGSGDGKPLPRLTDDDTEITAVDPSGTQLGVQLAPATEYDNGRYVPAVGSQATGTTIRGLRFQDFQSAVQFAGGSVTIEKNLIDCNQFYGHGIDGAGVGIRLVDNQVERCGSAIILTNCTDSVLRGNSVHTANYLATDLLVASGDRVTIANNVFENAMWGTVLSGNDNVISDNYVANNAANIVIQAGSANNRLERNAVAFAHAGGACSAVSCGVGVTLEGAIRTTISQNQITANGLQGIGVILGGNAGIQAPVITAAGVDGVAGTSGAADGSVVEVFSDPQDEGEQFLGQTTVSAGSWQFVTSAPSSRNVTATVTDPAGNTSEFSAPVAVP